MTKYTIRPLTHDDYNSVVQYGFEELEVAQKKAVQIIEIMGGEGIDVHLSEYEVQPGRFRKVAVWSYETTGWQRTLK